MDKKQQRQGKVNRQKDLSDQSQMILYRQGYVYLSASMSLIIEPGL